MSKAIDLRIADAIAEDMASTSFATNGPEIFVADVVQDRREITLILSTGDAILITVNRIQHTSIT